MNLESLISDNVRDIPPSPIRKFFDIVKTMEGAISLGIGEPDFVTPWHIRDAAISSINNGETSYTANAGTPELRSAVSRYLNRRFGLEYDISQIMVTVGASEAIDLAMRALINPGDEVIIPDPSYISYAPNVRLVYGRAVPLPTYASDGFSITPENLKKAITPRTKALVLPYPNNPTGGIMTREQLALIAEVLEHTDIAVIADEIYGELTYGGEHASIAQIPGMKERTVLISGFSKAFAMTGWRIGFLAAAPQLVKPMLKIHQYVIMCTSTMSQAAATEALVSNLDNNFEDIAKMRNSYNMRRRYIHKSLNDMGLACFEPRGAFYVFPCIRSSGLSSEEFATSLLHSKKIAVVPGNAFGESGEGYVRCSYAASMDDIREAMKRIAEFLKERKTK